MISHRHKFIFIGISKAASGSVRKTFDDLYDIHAHGPKRHGNTYYVHHGADYIKEHFDQKGWDWDNYFSFAFVRNPWARKVSLWKYWLLRAESKWSFKKYVIEKREDSKGYTPYYCDKEGNILLDFIGKVEDLQGGIDIICDKVGIPHRKLPEKHIHQTKHKHYTEYYDDETKQIVAERYAKDIVSFGYEYGE